MLLRVFYSKKINLRDMQTFTLIIIILALLFDYINGFHDAANSIATVVSTKVLSPFKAVLWASIFNFIAFFVFSDHNVANTIAKIVHQEYITHKVIFSGLSAAIIWSLFTWYLAIPSSSSHALIGGFVGAALVHSLNFYSIESTKILEIVVFIFLAPIIGMIIAIAITLFIMMNSYWKKLLSVSLILTLVFSFVPLNWFWKTILIGISGIFALSEALLVFLRKNPSNKAYNQMFKRLQLVSSAIFSLGHGGNDAQKVMGIIAVTLLIDKGASIDSVNDMPSWVPLSCYIAIGVGTLSGGWRIVKTMGTKITKVSPLEGVSAETAGALTLFITETFGIPVSTTHTITGSIMGVGIARRISSVRWSVATRLFWAWVITIPSTTLIATIIYALTSIFV